MATFFHSPIHPRSTHTLPLREISVHNDAIHPSQGAVMLDVWETHLATATVAADDPIQSNNDLVAMLENIQTELAAQRSIMLDIQSRMSRLELASLSRDTPCITSDRTQSLGSQPSPARCTTETPRGNRPRWETSKNSARNRDAPFIPELLKPSSCFPSFEFNFKVSNANPGAPPATPESDNAPPVTPELENVPELSPASDGYQQSEMGRSPVRAEASEKKAPSLISSPAVNTYGDGSDIVEHIVEFDTIRIPAPPILLSPPRSLRSKSTSISSEDEGITALPGFMSLPPLQDKPHHRCKGIKSRFPYKLTRRSKRSGQCINSYSYGKSIYFE